MKALFTEHGEAPAAGQLKRNKDLARTFRTLAEQGAQQGALHWAQHAPPCVTCRRVRVQWLCMGVSMHLLFDSSGCRSSLPLLLSGA